MSDLADARFAISDLVLTYAERIDLGDFDGVADLFTHAEVTAEGTPDVNRGKEAVLAMFSNATRRYPNGTPLTKHVTTNLIVEVELEAGTATGRSYFTVFQAVPGSLALQPVIAGRYRDRFERVDGAWRFAARHMIVDLVGDLSQHLLYDYTPPASS
jgi:hypothetical protein